VSFFLGSIGNDFYCNLPNTLQLMGVTNQIIDTSYNPLHL